MNVFVLVEDDLDDQLLVQAIFYPDSRFALTGMVDSAEQALERVHATEPGIIVLDHALNGPLHGLDAAPRLKQVAPRAKIILFTAHAELEARAAAEPAIDAFLLKSEAMRLLPLAQQLTGLGAHSN